MAHAALESVDTSEAENMPGVLGVFSAANMELAAVNGFPMIDAAMDRPPFAVGRVRYVGDIIAAVVAETLTQAQDAAEAVIVDYDPLPVVVDIEEAVAPGAPVIWEGQESNVCFAAGNEYSGPDVLEGAVAWASRREGMGCD